MTQQLDELKETIKKAEDRRDKLFEDKDRAWEKVQDQINKLEDQKLFLMKQQGESQPPAHAANFCCHAWQNSTPPKEILDLLKQSNESHAYPSRPFIAMSHFISFEPIIVPVSMLLPLCRLALETF